MVRLKVRAPAAWTPKFTSTPGKLKDAYLNEDYFFKPDNTAVGCPINAYEVFYDVITKLIGGTVPDRKKPGHNLLCSVFDHYDAWQMLKHLLSIYNYTSFVTQKTVEAFGKIPSMAGLYDGIVLLNVVNEFPVECVEDSFARAEYQTAMEREQEEAEVFRTILMNSEIPHLFDNNCHAGIEIKYVSAKKFAETIEMSEDKRNYLKRYFS